MYIRVYLTFLKPQEFGLFEIEKKNPRLRVFTHQIQTHILSAAIHTDHMVLLEDFAAFIFKSTKLDFSTDQSAFGNICL